MAQVIIRNLDEAVVAALKSRAAARKHSLEQELRLVLAESAQLSRKDVLATALSIRSLSQGPLRSDLEHLVREDRDR